MGNTKSGPPNAQGRRSSRIVVMRYPQEAVAKANTRFDTEHLRQVLTDLRLVRISGACRMHGRLTTIHALDPDQFLSFAHAQLFPQYDVILDAKALPEGWFCEVAPLDAGPVATKPVVYVRLQPRPTSSHHQNLHIQSGQVANNVATVLDPCDECK